MTLPATPGWHCPWVSLPVPPRDTQTRKRNGPRSQRLWCEMPLMLRVTSGSLSMLLSPARAAPFVEKNMKLLELTPYITLERTRRKRR